MIINQKFTAKALLTFSLLSSLILSGIKEAKCFIPAVYEPNLEELKSTAIELGKTASQLLYFGERKRALQLAKLATTLNPKADELWAVLAEIQIRNQNLTAARKSLNKAKELNPNDENYLFKEASIDFEEKKIDNSIILIEKGLSINPNSPWGYFQLGNSKIILKELKNALIAFEKATELKPNFWQSINNQGLVLYEMGNIEKAIVLWKQAIEIENDPEPILALAAAEYSLKQNKLNSILLAKKALARNPNYVFEIYQKEQLWGPKLRDSIKKVFKDPKMSNSVEKAKSNATIKKT